MIIMMFNNDHSAVFLAKGKLHVDFDLCVSRCSAKVMLYGIEEPKCLLLLWNICDMFEETLVK